MGGEAGMGNRFRIIIWGEFWKMLTKYQLSRPIETIENSQNSAFSLDFLINPIITGGGGPDLHSLLENRAVDPLMLKIKP